MDSIPISAPSGFEAAPTPQKFPSQFENKQNDKMERQQYLRELQEEAERKKEEKRKAKEEEKRREREEMERYNNPFGKQGGGAPNRQF